MHSLGKPANKRMQPDQSARCACTLAADAGRYASMRYFLYIILLAIVVNAWATIFDDPCMFISEKEKPCSWEIDNYIFNIDRNGIIEFQSTKTSLTLDEGFKIDWVRDGIIEEENAYFSLGITNGEAGGTIVLSFSILNSELNWQTNLRGFNGSPVLYFNGDVYAGASGMVTKIDAQTGAKDWEHTGLYDRDTQAFNGFKKPYVKGKSVVFPDDKTSTAKYEGLREIVVDIKTGEIVSD